MTTAQDGGKVVSLTQRPPLPPGNTPGNHFNTDEYQEYFLVVKAAGAYGWPSYHLHVLTVLKSWEPHPPGTLKACPGLYKDLFTCNLRYRLTSTNVQWRGLDIGSISLTSSPIKATSLMGKLKHSRSLALCTDVQFDHSDSCSVPHSLMDEVSQSPHLTGGRWGRLSKLLISFSFFFLANLSGGKDEEMLKNQQKTSTLIHVASYKLKTLKYLRRIRQSALRCSVRDPRELRTDCPPLCRLVS
jgi:hypothetical protein